MVNWRFALTADPNPATFFIPLWSAARDWDDASHNRTLA